jgi:ATP-binding cassette subfamily B multidrug efflux pump
MVETKKTGRETFKRILTLTSPYKTRFWLSIGLSVALAIVGPLRPKLVERAVDIDIAQKDFGALKITVLLMLVLLLLETSLRYLFSYLAGWLGASIIKDLRTSVYNHIVQAKLTYFDTTPIGTSTTRTINDVEAINDTFSEGILTILADVLVIVLVVFFMFAGNFHTYQTSLGFTFIYCDFSTWKLALASLSTLPVLLLITRWFQKGVKNAYQQERIQIARLNAFLQEHISGMRIIQLFNVQKREYARFDTINDELKTANIKGIWYYSLFFPAVEICVAASIGITVAMASQFVLKNELQLGVIMSFILYINMLFRPLRFIADKVNTIQRGVIAAERVFNLLDKPIAEPHAKATGQTSIQGNIKFEHVDFSYLPDQPILRDLSFEIAAGETLAIVGPTGSGKTSTISVLTKMYPISGGQIKIDNQDINTLNTDYLRSQMSIVLQDVFLFSGTVLENITLRNPSIKKEDVVNAAKSIGVDALIQKLPGQYDYKVMERGLALSLGQRQLISFVRALVYNPKILILDEATSSIDSETEAMVQKAIEKLIEGRTSIIIAHRLSTIRKATKILVLENGVKMEFGSHDTLLAAKAGYAKLWHSQFAQNKNDTVL